MKTFKRVAAQGDLMLIRIDSLPEGLVPFEPEGEHYVVAHSETGHNHVMLKERVTAHKEPGVEDRDLYKLFLNVEKTTYLEHQRSFDTHETIEVLPGNYMLLRQREYDFTEGYRKAMD